jgi:hypothetical protein
VLSPEQLEAMTGIVDTILAALGDPPLPAGCPGESGESAVIDTGCPDAG